MKTNYKVLILLHVLLMVYSIECILGKTAANKDFLSLEWCFLYGGVLIILALYALGWQQIIKRMPLTSAYANKAITTVWGLVWGVLFFKEKITLGKLLGIVLIVVGVILFSLSDSGSTREKTQFDNTKSTEGEKC